MLWSFLSWRTSPTNRTTVLLPRFCHQCAVPLVSDLISPAHNRIGAVAGVFDDLALGDIDDRWTVGVAVPGHDAARPDGELAKAKLAFLDVGRLLLEVDGGEHRVGDAFAGMGDRHTHVGFGLAGGTFAGGGHRNASECRARHHPGEDEVSAERGTCNVIEHGHGLLCYAPAAARPQRREALIGWAANGNADWLWS